MTTLRCEDLHDIDQALSMPAVHQYTTNIMTGYAMYQPVTPYQDAHGTVVAHLLQWNSTDNELTTDVYYSRGWAYWNYIDVFSDDFALANEAMEIEAFSGQVDYEIGTMVQAVEVVKDRQLPHENPYWQSVVVRMAYNALTSGDEFANLVKHSKYSVQDVQRMIDAAMLTVVNHGNFKIAGFDEVTG